MSVQKYIIPVKVNNRISYWTPQGLGSIYMAKVYPSYEAAWDGTCELQNINYGRSIWHKIVYTVQEPVVTDILCKTQTPV